MPRDDLPFTRRAVLLGVVVMVLIVCLIIYGTRNNQYALVQPPDSSSPLLTNSEVLQSWLPPSSYRYTITAIDNYLHTNNILASTLTVDGNVSVDEAAGGSYGFTLLLEPQDQTYKISVSVDNLNGTLSTSLSINGQQQGYLTPTQGNTGTQYSGIDSLVSNGITSLQASELQTAFQNFDPTAETITINTNSIVLPHLNPDSASLTQTYGFTVTINGKNYGAKLNTIGLTQIELFLTDRNTNKQVFDSGVISQSQ